MIAHESNQANSTTPVESGRRGFLKASAGVAAGTAGPLAAPFVHAQPKVTLRFLNAETAAASQAVLREAGNAYESKFGIKLVVDSSPISGTFAKATAAIKSGTPYDIGTMGFIAHVLQLADGGHLLPMTELVKKYNWGRMAAWKHKGENWFYPYDYNLVSVYYRKDLYCSDPEIRRQNRLMLAKMSSADLVQTKGFGSALFRSRYCLMACCSWRVERWVPRRIQDCVRVANQRSTWLIQEADVGVKWT